MGHAEPRGDRSWWEGLDRDQLRRESETRVPRWRAQQQTFRDYVGEQLRGTWDVGLKGRDMRLSW